MSATAVVLTPGLRNELAAAWRHFSNSVRLTARDPLALGVLAFAGVVTVFVWGGPVGFMLGIDPAFARQYPWRGWVAALTEQPSYAFHPWHLFSKAVILFPQLLGAAVVAGALGRSSAPRRWPAAAAPAMPALPIGLRARVVADVLAGAACVLSARVVVLWVGGVRLGRALYPPTYSQLEPLGTTLPSLATPSAVYASSLAVNTILGTLFALPLVLAWATTTRLDARGLVRVAAAALVVFVAAIVGAMAHLAPALTVCASVSAFLLARLSDGSRAERVSGARPLRFRGSPGPVPQLRRDASLGAVRRLRWALFLAGALPVVFTVVAWTPGVDAPPAHFLRSLAAMGAFLQWPTLLLLSLFPFGLALVPRGTSASGLFSGSFLRCWSALPVRREGVIRSVYVHGVVAAGFAWLILLVQVRLFGVRLGPVVFELPAVFLMAGIAVCEAVGDRPRGLLAVGALAGFQFGVPFVFALLPEVLGSPVPFARNSIQLVIAAYAVGLAGALPPLVHLRRRAGTPAPQA